MYLCEACHEKSGCDYVHLSGSTGPCESCRVAQGCLDCQHDRVELAPVTVEEIRGNLLAHLDELARTAASCGPKTLGPMMREVDCAKHMCRLAGIPEYDIAKVDRHLPSPAADMNGIPHVRAR